MRARVNITGHEKRDCGNGQFTVYHVEATLADDSTLSRSHSVWRRYSEFRTLLRHLARLYTSAVLPVLPPKKVTNSHGLKTIRDRRRGLESFLHRLLDHDILSTDKELLSFLTMDDWVCSVPKDTFTLGELASTLLNPTKGLINSSSTIAENDSKALVLQQALSSMVKQNEVYITATVALCHTLEVCGGLYSTWAADEVELKSTLLRISNLLTAQSSVYREEDDGNPFQDMLNEHYCLLGSLRKVIDSYKFRLRLNVESNEQLDRNKKDVQMLSSGAGTGGLRGLFQGKKTGESLDRLIENAKAREVQAQYKQDHLMGEIKNFEKKASYEIYMYFWDLHHDLKNLFLMVSEALLSQFQEELKILKQDG
eukprot:CFRG4955T1